MTSFSLSDVLRHVITGTFFLLFFSLLLEATADIELLDKGMFQQSEWLWIIILVISYPVGILIQSINKCLQKLNGFWITDLLFSRYSIKRKACILKNRHGKETPEWIYTADDPGKIVEYMEMKIENQKNAVINEYHYFCEFFQGLYIAIIMLPIVLSFTLPFIDAFDCKTIYSKLFLDAKSSFIMVIWFATGTLSYLFAHFYAKRFIHAIDAYKNILSINIDKYMHELGVQRVFVMMRARSDAKYLEEAVASIYRQDYYDINFVVLEDNDTPASENIFMSLHEKHGKERNNVRLLYYYHKSGNPAQSSYTIRNIILKIADRDDDIIFILDDDDMFAHNNVISDVVFRMNRKAADVCLVKYDVIGAPDMNIARGGGNTHNRLTTKLGRMEKSVTIARAPCLCFASSLGWSKIYRMGTLRRYFLMINDTKKDLKDLDLESYEDFPDFLVFLLAKNTTVTGLNESAYLYRKHADSATREISEKAFRSWRINQLELLVATTENPSSKKGVIEGYKKYLGYYLKSKTREIGDIIEKYQREGRMPDYGRYEFENDLGNSAIRPYLTDSEEQYDILKNCMDNIDNDKFDECCFDKNCSACLNTDR